MKNTKRLRIFAGPNGAGKSSVFRLIAEHYRMGASVDADALLSLLESGEGVSLPCFLPSLSGNDFEAFYGGHPLRTQYDSPFPFALNQDGRLTLIEACARSPKLSYAAVILADYLMVKLVEAGGDLSVETVLSHPSRLSFIRQAKASGYRVYLYYVGVASPEISKWRVALRAAQGGLGVPDDKIAQRYARSLALLKEAVSLSDQACLFDNTYTGASLKLQINQASEVIPHEPALPDWIVRSLPALIPRG